MRHCQDIEQDGKVDRDAHLKLQVAILEAQKVEPALISRWTDFTKYSFPERCEPFAFCFW
ncbi:MAG: hypothetical protein A3H57_03540 [Candidatus Taylorbacteria bacterium RIFCSPLOWO2_02_FULL_43_11]|uniref:Uncharacterized protein n=1 Tax=Candidatus Taylorbacteria bacterium RIFCSPHIGHO2_02_FULL_43_32b TaxID=1802306 RepID=A0A1G2MKH0_9BACT|nr:MAG: hypothetical protein A3C72_02195 [Candidatus Taylorbacteria bacterium RIFCSPHIGHO2_02_FULL_43_32b]OHA31707.1 MAG: hypothetical protein A3B08_01920 [Candidatus Taylorbacteria bacterium RIFCSPLOWO2_01_FULL_43_44]OHA36620.1 MAG: hypothetical protein A3H57_03540 [Candidatus Taylorbacteria bacterium RIFCSPLOWO2_02_FULL_43_11]